MLKYGRDINRGKEWRETSLEDAQEISDKLGDLLDEKEKRIQEEMQDSELSKNTNSRCTKMGKVDNITRLEGEGEDEAIQTEDSEVGYKSSFILYSLVCMV